MNSQEGTRQAAGRLSGCPHLDGYDPLSAEDLRDPYPSYARARKEAPVFFSEELGFWSVTKHQDLLQVLRDTENFSASEALPPVDPPPALRERMPHYPWRRSLLLMDDPEHRHARAIEQAPFTARNVQSREPALREAANRLLDPFADSGSIEFVKDYAIPFSLSTLGAIVGAEEEDFELLEEGVTSLMTTLNAIVSDSASEDELVEMGEELVGFSDYVSALIEDRRRSPRDDYTSVMIHTQRADGSVASTEEITQAVIDLLGAGFKTTAQALALGLLEILSRPDQWQALLADRSLVPNAIEEMLRFRGVATRTFRKAVNDVVVGEVEIPAGSLVALCLASAGRDEDVYDRPEVFDVTRARPQHLAFGKWQHFCVGAQLARLEMKVTFDILLDRFPDLRIAPDQELVWVPDIRVDILQELQLEA